MPELLPPTRQLDIVWQAGDDTPAVLTVPGSDGTPLNVTGWSALAIVVHNGREVHRWTSADGSATCGPDGVTLLADDSADWRWHRGRYDLRLEALDGTRRVPVGGDMLVRPLRIGPASPEPEVPVDQTALVALHGDSWDSPAFAVALNGAESRLDDLTEWWLRAEVRGEDDTAPTFAWTTVLPPAKGSGVELYGVPATLADGTELELPAISVHLEPGDWVGKPRRFEGFLEIELTRGTLDAPTGRRTIVPRRPFRITPDLLP